MKLVVIGGTGLIGAKLVAKLAALGHEAIAASPRTGVDTITGKGLAEALRGASVVVDVTNPPSFADAPVLEFFTKSTTNLLRAEAAAGVGHHVALGVVGTERLIQSGYFRAKLEQEKLILESVIPHSIVRATQFFEFVKSIADYATVDGRVRVSSALIQPIAADDVANEMQRVALGAPLNAIVEVGGPETFHLDALVRERLNARRDPREVVADPQALYSGALLSERTLVAGDDARLGAMRFKDWLAKDGAA